VAGGAGAWGAAAQAWPCETRRLTEAVTGGERP